MKRLITLILIICAFNNMFAQFPDSLKSTKIISIVPQYVFQNGFRVDYEFNMKNNKKSWIQFSPEFFINTGSESMTGKSYKSMSGIGLEIHHKYFMDNHNRRFGYYMAYGTGYQHYGIKDNQQVKFTYSENGAEYFSYKSADVTTPINRILLNFVFGKQVILHKPIILDYYLGVGFRYSMTNKMELIDNYNETWFDYGYSGSLLVAGFKFGFSH